MKRFLWGLVAAAAVLVAVVVPAASAKSAAVRLSSLPLAASSLGSAVHGLALARGSGAVSNAAAANETTDATTKTMTKLGRINGYVLLYGNAESGAAGVTFVGTGVEQYKTAADAKKGLAFWQKEDSQQGDLDQGSFSVTNVLVKVPAVGKKRFAYLTSYSDSNIAPVSFLDERVADGPYVLDVTVAAGSASTAKGLAPKLAKKLDARLHLALEGRLHAKPVKLLGKQKAGPPPGGPDLSALALQTSDFVNGTTTLSGEGYFPDPAAISDYSVLMQPGDGYSLLDQEIEWYPTANQASFEADFANASALTGPNAAPVDLSSVGDGAQGAINDDSSLSFAQAVLSSGHLAEFVFILEQNSPISPADLTNISQIAANRINGAGLGS